MEKKIYNTKEKKRERGKKKGERVKKEMVRSHIYMRKEQKTCVGGQGNERRGKSVGGEKKKYGVEVKKKNKKEEIRKEIYLLALPKFPSVLSSCLHGQKYFGFIR